MSSGRQIIDDMAAASGTAGEGDSLSNTLIRIINISICSFRALKKFRVPKMTDNSLIGPSGGDSGCYVRTPHKLAIVISFVAGSLLGAVATIIIQVLNQQLWFSTEKARLCYQ